MAASGATHYRWEDIPKEELKSDLHRRLIPAEISHFKLLYGSDNNNRFAEEIRDWQTVFDMLRMPEDERERIFYGNAARLFGVIPIELPVPTPEPAGAATGDGA